MCGHTVRIVGDGPTALGAVQAFQPDCVLLDVGLPGMNGFDVARRLRAETGSADLVIVTVSGYAHEGDRLLSKQAGWDGHLVKPVGIDSLRVLLERAQLS